MTTGKNKERFENWYLEKYHKCGKTDNWASYWLLRFDESLFEMQIGVYLAYYDSLGIDVNVDCEEQSCYVAYIYHNRDIYNVIDLSTEPLVNTRNEAYKEVFKKVDELINQQN